MKKNSTKILLVLFLFTIEKVQSFEASYCHIWLKTNVHNLALASNFQLKKNTQSILAPTALYGQELLVEAQHKVREGAQKTKESLQNKSHELWLSTLDRGSRIASGFINWGKNLISSRGLSLILKNISTEQESKAQALAGLLSEPAKSNVTWKNNPVKKLFQTLFFDPPQYVLNQSVRKTLLRHAEKKRLKNPAKHQFSLTAHFDSQDFTQEGLQKLRALFEELANEHPEEKLIHHFTVERSSYANRGTILHQLVDEYFPKNEAISKVKLIEEMSQSGGPLYSLSRNKEGSRENNLYQYKYRGIDLQTVHVSPLNGVLEFVTGHTNTKEIMNKLHERTFKRPLNEESWFIGKKKLTILAYIPLIIAIYSGLPYELQESLAWMNPLSILLMQGADSLEELDKEREEEILKTLILYHERFSEIKHSAKGREFNEEDYQKARDIVSKLHYTLLEAKKHNEVQSYQDRDQKLYEKSYSDAAKHLETVLNNAHAQNKEKESITQFIEERESNLSYPTNPQLSEEANRIIARFNLLDHPYYNDLLALLLKEDDSENALWVKQLKETGFELQSHGRMPLRNLDMRNEKDLRILDFFIRMRTLDLEEVDYFVYQRTPFEELSPSTKERILTTQSSHFYKRLHQLQETSAINSKKAAQALLLWISLKQKYRFFAALGAYRTIESPEGPRKIHWKDIEKEILKQLQIQDLF